MLSKETVVSIQKYKNLNNDKDSLENIKKKDIGKNMESK